MTWTPAQRKAHAMRYKRDHEVRATQWLAYGYEQMALSHLRQAVEFRAKAIKAQRMESVRMTQ